jgi:hypothetical protein
MRKEGESIFCKPGTSGALRALALWVVAICIVTSTGYAASFTFNYSVCYTGVSPDSNIKPWLTAKLTDFAPGQVLLALTAANLNDYENVKSWRFNFDPAFTAVQVGGLNFSKVASTGSFKNPTIRVDEDAINGGGGFEFDFNFAFAPGDDLSKTFSAGNSVTYLISGIPTLDITDFMFLSSSANGAFFSIAHIQNTGWRDSESGWVGAPFAPYVPEPGTVAGSIAALVFGVAVYRRYGKAPAPLSV